MAPFFTLDNDLNIISTDSKDEWKYFFQHLYPNISEHWPYIRTKSYYIYIAFYGINKYNLFQVVILNNFGIIIDYSTTINSWNDALEAFNNAINIYT